jgi:hypothetical protein
VVIVGVGVVGVVFVVGGLDVVDVQKGRVPASN